MSARDQESVSFDTEHGLAVLRTPHSVYALRIGEDGSPRHIYWGEPLDFTRLRGWYSPADSSFESDPAPDELSIETGPRFGPAGLRVRFADGVRGAQWRFEGHRIVDEEPSDGADAAGGAAGTAGTDGTDGTDGGRPGARVLRLRLVDRVYPLAVELAYRVRPDSDVIERWTEISHTGTVGSEPSDRELRDHEAIDPDAPIVIERCDSAS